VFNIFGGCVPVDKESCRIMTAMAYLRAREEEEIEKVGKLFRVVPTPTESIEKTKMLEDVKARFRKKEIALMRHVAGPLAKLVDESRCERKED
jgi:hypothetical protein